MAKEDLSMSQTEIQIHDARSLANYRKGNLLVLLATAVVVFGGTKPLQAQTYTNVYCCITTFIYLYLPILLYLLLLKLGGVEIIYL